MSGNIEEMVSNSVEDIAVVDVVEKTKQRKKNRWEVWVALSSSLLAVLSAVAALLATFASDEAAIALSNESDFAAYAGGLATSRTMLQAKLELLASMGKPPTDADVDELKRIDAESKALSERSKRYETEGAKAFKTHDLLAIAVTLFQVTMLLSGVAVMVDRAVIWHFGLAFSMIGLLFFVRGLIGYMG